MTHKELAEKLDGIEYYPKIDKGLLAQAKENGLVIVHGYADDNCELLGAIEEEISCWDGESINFNKEGSNFCNDDGDSFLTYHDGGIEKCPNNIKAIWCPKGVDVSWIYKTDIPHSEFKVLEDGGVYCYGIVFSIDDLK